MDQEGEDELTDDDIQSDSNSQGSKSGGSLEFVEMEVA